MARKTDASLAVGYVRVSTDEQCLGPVAQRKIIEAFAAASGLTLVAVYEDHITGTSSHTARPGAAAAMATLRATNAGTLIAQKRDRLGRDAEVTQAFEKDVKKLGARVQTPDLANVAGSSRVLLSGVLDAVSSFERATIVERTTLALGVKKARGERVGALPYGYTVAEDGVRLVPVQAEQDVIATVLTLRQGGLSTYAIVDRLSALGHRSRTGRGFNRTQVCRMLSRAA